MAEKVRAVMGYYHSTPENPLTDVLRAMTGVEPPKYTHGLYSSSELGDRAEELQGWCREHARPEWSTGIGIMEAADHIVGEAVANANIAPKGSRR